MTNRKEIRSFIDTNDFGGGKYPDYLSRIIADSQEITIDNNSFRPVVYALFYACKIGKLDFVNSALQADGILRILAESENKHFEQKNLFQVAAESGNIELVRCFIDLKWGRAMYHEGKDPAYYAVLNDRRDVVDLLLDNPTQINRQYEDGSRLIHIAVLDNNPEMTSLLLAKGADVNKTYRGENTPLHLSAHLGFPDLAEILIESGASVFLRNRDGHKPIDLAADGSEVKIILQNRELEINQANNIICAITSPRTNPRLAGAQNMTQNIPEALLKILKTTLVGRH